MNIQSLFNIVRIGTVSSLDVANRTARVEFADKKDVGGNTLISAPLKVIQTVEWLPKIGDFVLCIYLPNGESDGFVIGSISII